MTGNPHHVVIDCGSGEVTHTPLTDAEVAERAAMYEEWLAGHEAAQAAARELAAAVAAHPDPLVQELARRLGIA